MRSLVTDYLAEVIDGLAHDTDGEVDTPLPGLAESDPDVFGVALTTVDGRTYGAGDDDVEFAIQSIAKPFVYAAALADRGFELVDRTVGVEPSGEAFDELSLETESGRPKNPMINAGAIATHSLLIGPDASADDRFERTLTFFSTLAGRRLSVDKELAEAELAEGDRNLAIAHMLRSHDVVTQPADDVMRGYVRQSAILVTVRDLALMGATLANGGIHPVSGERVVATGIARQTMAVMAGCGMYDGSGEWLTSVGIPAKSGVSGGVLGTLPGQCGIAVISPRLDAQGNSERGMKAFRRLSSDLNMHLMETEDYGRTVLRSVRTEGDTLVFDLAGVMRFDGAEFILHTLQEDSSETDTIILDLTQVGHISEVAGQMLAEAAGRLREGGRKVELVDPDGLLPDSR